MNQNHEKAKQEAAANQRAAQVIATFGGIPPKVLYKYAPVNLAHIHNVLVSKKVWFAGPRTFNDPFDCRVVLDLSSSEAREKWARRVVNAFDEAGEPFQILRAQGAAIPSREAMMAQLERVRSGDDAHISRFVKEIVSGGRESAAWTRGCSAASFWAAAWAKS